MRLNALRFMVRPPFLSLILNRNNSYYAPIIQEARPDVKAKQGAFPRPAIIFLRTVEIRSDFCYNGKNAV